MKLLKKKSKTYKPTNKQQQQKTHTHKNPMHVLSPWNCKAWTSIFSFCNVKQKKPPPSDYNNILKCMGRQTNETRFFYKHCHTVEVLHWDHSYSTIWNASWPPCGCNYKPLPHAASCHFRLCLHPHCLGCVYQQNFFFLRKEESDGSLYLPR